jgi:hypothetical protein
MHPARRPVPLPPPPRPPDGQAVKGRWGVKSSLAVKTDNHTPAVSAPDEMPSLSME